MKPKYADAERLADTICQNARDMGAGYGTHYVTLNDDLVSIVRQCMNYAELPFDADSRAFGFIGSLVGDGILVKHDPQAVEMRIKPLGETR